ncbi:MAG: 2-keto-4-methylthiobutyrate aminotransferase [Alphaproteobacteria bacterium]|nr:2-keto-4-methylthiobutyrate aminotransferase [Alphaproteobacteria bacterium]
MEIIYVNGEFSEISKARVSPIDRGLTLGDGLFETIRVRDGKMLRLDAHFARLRNGAKNLDIKVPLSDQELIDVMQTLLDMNSMLDARVRLTLTRGEASHGLVASGDETPTLIIRASKFTPLPSPVRAIVSKHARRNEHSILIRCKCVNYLEGIMAMKEAKDQGANEAVVLNCAGRVAEMTISNVFAVIDGEIVTPPVSEGALPGVMRADVIKHFGVMEKPLAVDDLLSASEVFVTSSSGTRPVVEIEGKLIGNGEQGEITTKVIEANL